LERPKERKKKEDPKRKKGNKNRKKRKKIERKIGEDWGKKPSAATNTAAAGHH
jgi:hypothetical protein